MYDPNFGRFLSLDPPSPNRADILYEHPFVYSRNNPVNRVDPSGHWSEPCKNEPPQKKGKCDDVCEDAKKQCKGFYGCVICCDCKKYSCAYPDGPWDFLRKCITKHEDTHQPQVDCTKPDLYRPPFKKGVDQAVAECEAYKTHLKCLEDESKACDKFKGDERTKCEKAYKDEVERVKGKIKYWCKGDGKEDGKKEPFPD